MKTMKKYIFALIATMFLPLSMMAEQKVAGSVKNVDTGVIYESLQEAVDNAESGATIEILDDIYDFENGGELTIEKSITITGAVESNGEPKYTIYGQSTNNGYHDIFINGGETVTVTLSNLKVQNFGNEASLASSHAAIYVSTNFKGQLTLQNVYVSNFNRAGIYLYGGEFDVDGCYIDCTSNTGFTKGIEIQGSAHGTIQNTVIQNMECSNDTWSVAGIEIYGKGSVLVDNCTILSKEGTKETNGILSQRVGAHDPSGGYLQVKATSIDVSGVALGVADNDAYGTTDNYTIEVEDANISGGAVAIWNASSCITLNSGDYSGVSASEGTIVINGGNYTEYITKGTDGEIIVNDGDIVVDEVLIDEDLFDVFRPYVADGAVVDVDNDGNYVIKEPTPTIVAVASVNDGVATTNYASIELAFAHASEGSTITLLTDAALSENIACSLTSGSLTITFGDYSITKGDYSVSLEEGVTVTTDKQTDIFTAATSGNMIVETPAGAGYEYSSQIPVAQVESKYYATFEEAATAAGNEKVITLLADITDTYTLSAGQTLKVAKNGHDITVEAPSGSELYEEVVTIDEQEVTVYGLKTDIAPLVDETLRSTYTGSEQSAPLVIKDGEYTLVKGTDYKLQVGGVDVEDVTSTNPGPVEFTVVGINKYNNSKDVTWTIYKDINDASIRIEVDPAIYSTEDVVDPADYVHVYSGDDELEEGADKDYTIEVTTEIKDAKTYINAVTVKGTERADNYLTGEVTFNFELQPLSLSDFVVTATAPYVAAGYGENNAGSGAAVKVAATIVVKAGNGEDWSGYDGFEITIDNDPTAANNYNNTGTYTGVVHVTVKEEVASNFTGSVPAGDLTIGEGIDISTSLVVSSPEAIYTGAALPPSENTIVVKSGSDELTFGTDYDIILNGEESDFVNAKTYHNAVTIKGKGAYMGDFIADYTILPRSLTDEDITVTVSDLNYTGDPQDVTITVKYKENEIPAANYNYTPTEVTEAGKYVVTVTAVDNSNLLSSTTEEFWVKKSMADFADDFTIEPDPIPTQTATGSEIKPEIIVKDNSRTMILDEDYELTYSDNIEPGEATITITGINAYVGTLTTTFIIVPEFFDVDGISYHHGQEGDVVTVGKEENDEMVLATTLTGAITVPATITYDNKTFDVVGIDEHAFSGDGITSVTLPESIETIADKAFSECNDLRWLDIMAMQDFTPTSLDRLSDRGPFSKVPKQTLIFLNGTTTTGENYIYNTGGSTLRCDVLKIYEDMDGNQLGFADENGYNWGFENPYAFKANTVVNTRQLNATNGQGKQQGYTTCLPYKLTIPASFKAYTLSASSDKLLGFVEVTGTLEALTPYVIIPSASGQLLSTANVDVLQTYDPVSGEDVELESTTSQSANGNVFTLCGNMRYQDGMPGSYIMQNGNQWKQTAEGSYGNGSCILPMRAYIMMGGAPAPVFYSYFGFSEGMNIEDLTQRLGLGIISDDDAYYDLNGRQIATPTRGVYIHNGKKVVIK